MKTEKLIQAETLRRMGKLAKSRLHVYLLIALAATLLLQNPFHYRV